MLFVRLQSINHALSDFGRLFPHHEAKDREASIRIYRFNVRLIGLDLDVSCWASCELSL